MYIAARSVDDLMHRVLSKLLKRGRRVEGATKGKNLELPGVLLSVSNPLARISRTEKRGIIFSALGELLWYLAGSNRLDFIEHYLSRYGQFSDDGRTIYGAYGPRLLRSAAGNQIKNVIEQLRRKQDSRRAVVQLFDALDVTTRHRGEVRADIPCTCTLQFMIRKKKLLLMTSMRSNDAYLGLPHDIFSFTMIQELVARSLGVEIGTYKHFAASLHIYDNHITSAEKYVGEGWQERIAMPPMPAGDPWRAVSTLLKAERQLRRGGDVKIEKLQLSEYWRDLVRLLKIFTLTKPNTRTKRASITKLWTQMSSPVFDGFIRRKHDAQSEPEPQKPVQPRLL